MKHTGYLQAKEQLKSFADELKTNDMPLRRQSLNDYTDSLLKELSLRVSGERYNLYQNWLVNYCISRHDK